MGGNNNDISSTATGQLVADLIDTDGNPTGISFSIAQGARIATDANGRNAGANATDQAMNQGGQYATLAFVSGGRRIWESSLQFPAEQTDIDFRFALCTTFSGQDDIQINYNDVQDAGLIGHGAGSPGQHDGSGNTGGVMATSAGISTNAAGLLAIQKTVTNKYLYINAIEFTYSGGGSSGGSIQPLAHMIRQGMYR